MALKFVEQLTLICWITVAAVGCGKGLLDRGSDGGTDASGDSGAASDGDTDTDTDVDADTDTDTDTDADSDTDTDVDSDIDTDTDMDSDTDTDTDADSEEDCENHGQCPPCQICDPFSQCVDADLGEDIKDDCKEEEPGSCGTTGVCDGAGQCERFGPTTPCNDGLFCTATDRCDGNGSCQGTGDPCPSVHAECNDDSDKCDCDPGWAEPDCDTCAIGFAGSECAVCEVGYLSPDCTVCDTINGYEESGDRCIFHHDCDAKWLWLLKGAIPADAHNGTDFSYENADGDQTVLDNITGLEWTRCLQPQRIETGPGGVACQGDGPYDDLLISSAEESCANLVTADHDDWRLPSIDELISIVDFSVIGYNDRIDVVAFDTFEADTVWQVLSSTVFPSNPDQQYMTQFDFRTTQTASQGAVLCTRDYTVTLPPERFQVDPRSSGDIILDNWAWLKWQRCPAGQVWEKATQTCMGEIFKYNWEEMIEVIEGTSNNPPCPEEWRVPTIRELATLINFCRAAPASYGAPFPKLGIDGDFLSATYAYATPGAPDNDDYIEGVRFTEGEVYQVTYHFMNTKINNVICVQTRN